MVPEFEDGRQVSLDPSDTRSDTDQDIGGQNRGGTLGKFEISCLCVTFE